MKAMRLAAAVAASLAFATIPAQASKHSEPRAQTPQMCQFFNQPGLDVVLWTVPCRPAASPEKPVRLCKVFDHPGLDVVLWTVPCDAPVRVSEPMRMCRFFDHPGLDVILWTVPCEVPGKR